MAFTVTQLDTLTFQDRKHYRWSIVGTAIGTSSEAILLGAPQLGKITYFKCNKSAGSATTIQPAFLNDAGATQTGFDKITKAAATFTLSGGVLIDNSDVKYSTNSGTGKGTIYLNLNVDSGSDNTVAVEVGILEGWY